MDRNNTVSVIIATRNSEDTIESAVNSLLNQTYKLNEIIIVDDYSEDSTSEIISKINDSRIIFYKKNEPRYLAASRNIGINLSTSEFITFLDADDISVPSRIEIQLNKIIKTNADVCGTNIKYKFKKEAIIQICQLSTQK